MISARCFTEGQGGTPALEDLHIRDVVSGLNQVVAYDWRGFWTERLTNHGARCASGGIEGSGWK